MDSRMNEELTKRLIEKYPKIFTHESGKPNYWSIDCGDGWYTLIEMLCDRIQSRCDCVKKSSTLNSDDWDIQTQFEAIQVKEKFGTLRIYGNGGDDYVFGLIEMAEQISSTICIQCGSNHNVKMTTGWITPFCEKCYALENCKLKNEI